MKKVFCFILLIIIIVLICYFVFVRTNNTSYEGDIVESDNTEVEELEEYVALFEEMGTVADNKTKENGTVKALSETENVILRDDNGNPVTIPAGFGIAKDSATIVEDGIIIEDTSGTKNETGNQFVWIPVGIELDTESEEKVIKLSRYNFGTQGTTRIKKSEDDEIDADWDTSVKMTETKENSVAKNIEEFINSANQNRGYYIGRYEAGTDKARTEKTDDSKLVSAKVKGNINSYIYATRDQSLKLSQEMYDDSNFTSDLINSYAWDTAIIFIEKCGNNNDYAHQIRLQSTIATTGNASDGTNKDVECNIYDLTGNVCEWTTEYADYSSEGTCCSRGGSYHNSYSCTASRYSGDPKTSDDIIGFRPIIYINIEK